MNWRKGISNSLNAVVKQQELKGLQGQCLRRKASTWARKRSLSYSEIRSPIDGVVTDRSLYPARWQPPEHPETVMDISLVTARASYPQTMLPCSRSATKPRSTFPGWSNPLRAR